jgi:RNA polymerase sigma-70 factor (ECF subfamily)
MREREIQDLKTDLTALLKQVALLDARILLRQAINHSRQLIDAWDLLQDAFERALRSRPPVRDGLDLRRWLLRVMRNSHLDQRRRAAVHGRTCLDIETLAHPVSPDEPEPPVWTRVEIEEVAAALPALHPPLRNVFALHMNGHDTPAIARKLSLRPATVATRLFRARRDLRRRLWPCLKQAQGLQRK